MKKSVALTIFGIMAAVIIGVGVYAWTLDSRLGDSSRVASAYSGSAMGEFTGALTELDEAMRESRYATDSTILSTLCAKASANAASAVTALASLPYSTQELEVLAQYLNGTGDYTLYLSKEAAEGRMLSASELENLSQLSDAVREISAQTSGIFAALDAGDLTMDEYGANSDGAVSGTVGYELAALNAALDEFPELEYSGRYSSSVMGAPAAYLEGQDAVSEKQARAAAAEFIGIGEDELEPTGRSESVYGVYGFTQKLPDGSERSVSVSEAGGVVVSLTGTCSGGTAKTGRDDAEKTASKLLQSAFGDTFVPVSYSERSGSYVFTFAPETDGVILMPDTVEVTVDAATGEVCAYNAENYVMYHAARDSLVPSVGAETARQAVPESLTINDERLALTRSDGGDEALCWEFGCTNEAGEAVYVFVDAKTGLQAKIELTN